MNTEVRGRKARPEKAKATPTPSKKPPVKPTPRAVSKATTGKGKGRQPNTPQRSPSRDYLQDASASPVS